jgi:hypothetical protein
MNLDEELNKLEKYIGTEGDKFERQLVIVTENFTSDKDKDKIHKFMKDSARNFINDTDEFIKDTTLRI